MTYPFGTEVYTDDCIRCKRSRRLAVWTHQKSRSSWCGTDPTHRIVTRCESCSFERILVHANASRTRAIERALEDMGVLRKYLVPYSYLAKHFGRDRPKGSLLNNYVRPFPFL